VWQEASGVLWGGAEQASWSIGVLGRQFSGDGNGDGDVDGGVTGHCTADADTFFPGPKVNDL